MKIIDQIQALTFINLQGLASAFFSQNPLDWRYNAEIIEEWTPETHQETWPSYGKSPKDDPITAVRYQSRDCHGNPSDFFLRYSQGPNMDVFWDMYPSDFKCWSLAFKALVNAPPPPCLWVARNHELHRTTLEQSQKLLRNFGSKPLTTRPDGV